jgi:PAS domain S-box-containing protein
MVGKFLAIGKACLVTIVAVLSLFFFKRLTDHYLVFVETPFQFFMVSTLIASWYGGFSQGLASIALAILLSVAYFFPDFRTLGSLGPATELRIALFALNGTIVSGICWTLQRARRSLDEAREQLYTGDQFRSIYDSNMIGLLFARLDGSILKANDYVLEMLGYSRDDLLQGRVNWLQITPDEHMSATREAIERLSHQDVIRPFEKQFLHKDGRPISVLIGSAILDRARDLIVTFVLDITDRKLNQDALNRAYAELEEKVARRTHELSESRSFLDSIIEHLPVMLFIKDATDLKFVRFNKAGEELIGHSREELIGKTDFDFFPAEQAASFIAKDRQVLEGAKVVDIAEEPIQTKRGERILHTRKIPIIGKDGKPSFLLGVSEDITDMKAAEAQSIRLMEESAARREAERVAQQMAFSAEAVRILSSSLNYKDTLHSFARLVVPRMADLCSIDIIEENEQPHTIIHIHRDPETTNRMADYLQRFPKNWNAKIGSGAAMRSGRPILISEFGEEHVKMLGVTEEQHEFLLSLKIRSAMFVPLQVYDKVLGTLSFALSDTDRRYTDLDLSFATDFARGASFAIENARLFERAHEANRAKSAFLANMSHEIRTPLGAMLGFAELTLESKRLASEEQVHMRTIIRNGRQLLRIVNDILDLSKVESDRLSIEQIQFSFHQLVEDIESLLHLQAEEKGLALRFHRPDNLPDTLVCDPTRVRQILINVIGNALKFTDQGGVDVSLGVEPQEDGNGYLIEARVQDSGIGITTEQAKRLFRPFAQGDSSMTRKFGGTGLGLYLSKRLAQVLGGDLVLEKSHPGKGSLFRITFKALKASAEIPLHGNRRPVEDFSVNLQVTEGASVGKLKVLVADDAPDNRLLVSHYVSQMGYSVETAEDGRQAVDKALQGDFDVILMDIQMPRMDGFQALEHLRKENYTGPIVALTAHAMKGDRERCIEAGFDSYLVKPIDKTSLSNLLKGNTLRGKRSHEPRA